MKTTLEIQPSRPSWIERSPLAAAIVGVLVTEAGLLTWSGLLVSVPAPWSFLLMAAGLVFFVLYFSGRILPASPLGFRAVRFRAKGFSDNVLPGMAAALLFVLTIESAIMVNSRLVDFQEQAFLQYNSFIMSMPGWMQATFIVVASLVAGICEETGFRGYLQVPLEKGFGPSAATLCSGILFTLFHLNQPWAVPILPVILLAGILLSMLAYRSRSLTYSIIAHVIMDIFNFTFWWSTIGGRAGRDTIWKAGMDVHFIFWLALFLASTGLFVFTCLKKIKMHSSTGSDVQ